eukprot:4447984-Amphidinium_carterae.1
MVQWIAPHRPDILYALKELGHQLAAPRQTDWQFLRRRSKYLERTEHYETRKSTSCAMVFWGNLLFHVHSRTQTTRALSSGEAEWYGCCVLESGLTRLNSASLAARQGTRNPADMGTKHVAVSVIKTQCELVGLGSDSAATESRDSGSHQRGHHTQNATWANPYAVQVIRLQKMVHLSELIKLETHYRAFQLTLASELSTRMQSDS